MNRIAIFMLCLLTAIGVRAQSPLVLSNTGYLLIGTDSVRDLALLRNYKTVGLPDTNASWDLSYVSMDPQAGLQVRTPPPANSPFPAASYVALGGVSLANGVNYLATQFVESRSDGFLWLGAQVPQRYAQSIQAYTLGAGDSIVFPKQTDTFSLPTIKLAFPATYGTSWRSLNSRRRILFGISAAAFQLSDTPGVWHSYRSYEDTVVGWGMMRVMLFGKGASTWMPVLQVHETITVTDSFFINNASPPTGFLAAFNRTQGATQRFYFTRFYRAGELTPLADFQHADSSFGNVVAGMMQQNRLTANGVANLAKEHGWKTFPNPARSGKLLLSMPGNQSLDWHFALINMAGQTAAGGALRYSGGTEAGIDLPAGLARGFYVLHLSGRDGSGALPLILE